MGFLRRLLGGSDERPSKPDHDERPVDERRPHGVDDDLPDDEVERERALLRADAARLDDDLIQRQLRYADRSWTPPPQGGDLRAEDKPEAGG